MSEARWRGAWEPSSTRLPRASRLAAVGYAGRPESGDVGYREVQIVADTDAAACRGGDDGDLVKSTTDIRTDPDSDLALHAWRVEQLRRLGLQRYLAELFADGIDWHLFARLVECGCSPELALEIVR